MKILKELFGLFRPSDVEYLKAKKDVKRLWKLIKKNDPKTRTPAKMALVEIGQSAVPMLIQVLVDRDKYFGDGTSYHTKASRILYLMGESAIEPLANFLKDENKREQIVASEILAGLPKGKATEVLMKNESLINRWIDDLYFGNEEACIEATRKLAKMGDKKAIEAFVFALEKLDRPQNAGLFIAKTLAELGDKRAIKYLERFLKLSYYLFSLHYNYWQYVQTGLIRSKLREGINEKAKLHRYNIQIPQNAIVSREGDICKIKCGAECYIIRKGSEVTTYMGGSVHDLKVYRSDGDVLISGIKRSLRKIKEAS